MCDEALNNLYQSDGENISMFESSLQVETHSYKGVRIQMQGQDGDADFRALFKEVRQQVLDKFKGHLESRSHQVKMLGAMQVLMWNDQCIKLTVEMRDSEFKVDKCVHSIT